MKSILRYALCFDGLLTILHAWYFKTQIYETLKEESTQGIIYNSLNLVALVIELFYF